MHKNENYDLIKTLPGNEDSYEMKFSNDPDNDAPILLRVQK